MALLAMVLATPAVANSKNPDFNRGVDAMTAGDNRGAIVAFSSAIAADPRDWYALVDRGNAYYALREWDNAAADYRKALAIKADYDTWVALGNTLDNSGDYNGAVVAYRSAIALNGRKADAWIELGVAQSSQKNMGDAAKSFETAVKLEPRNGRAQKLLGDIYFQLNRPEDAVAPLQKAEKLLPGDIVPPRRLGDAYQDLKRADDASAAYDRALAIDGADFETLMNKGNLYYNQGDYGAALAFYRLGVKAQPNNAWAQSYLGDTYYNTGAFSQARYAYDAALAIDNQFIDALKGGARARLQLGDKEGARKMVERLRRIDSKAGEALSKELFP